MPRHLCGCVLKEVALFRCTTSHALRYAHVPYAPYACFTPPGWRYVGDLCSARDSHMGVVWECPFLVQLQPLPLCAHVLPTADLAAHGAAATGPGMAAVDIPAASANLSPIAAATAAAAAAAAATPGTPFLGVDADHSQHAFATGTTTISIAVSAADVPAAAAAATTSAEDIQPTAGPPADPDPPCHVPVTVTVPLAAVPGSVDLPRLLSQQPSAAIAASCNINSIAAAAGGPVAARAAVDALAHILSAATAPPLPSAGEEGSCSSSHGDISRNEARGTAAAGSDTARRLLLYQEAHDQEEGSARWLGRAVSDAECTLSCSPDTERTSGTAYGTGSFAARSMGGTAAGFPLALSTAPLPPPSPGRSPRRKGVRFSTPPAADGPACAAAAASGGPGADEHRVTTIANSTAVSSSKAHISGDTHTTITDACPAAHLQRAGASRLATSSSCSALATPATAAPLAASARIAMAAPVRDLHAMVGEVMAMSEQKRQQRLQQQQQQQQQQGAGSATPTPATARKPLPRAISLPTLFPPQRSTEQLLAPVTMRYHKAQPLVEDISTNLSQQDIPAIMHNDVECQATHGHAVSIPPEGRWMFGCAPDACHISTGLVGTRVTYWMGRYDSRTAKYDMDVDGGGAALDMGNTLYAPALFTDPQVRLLVTLAAGRIRLLEKGAMPHSLHCMCLVLQGGGHTCGAGARTTSCRRQQRVIVQFARACPQRVALP